MLSLTVTDSRPPYNGCTCPQRAIVRSCSHADANAYAETLKIYLLSGSREAVAATLR